MLNLFKIIYKNFFMREIHIKDDSKKTASGRVSRKNVEPIEAENEFEVQTIEEEEAPKFVNTSLEDEAKDYVKVKFRNFVQLIANHDFKSVIDRHTEDDIVMKSDLLTDLANAHSEEKKDGNQPIVLAIGILLGIAAAYILFKFF